MATLGIKGHPIRGREVIQLLEMLGGVNYFALEGTQTDGFYYVSKDNNKIYHCWDINTENVIVYILEEFEKLYPYKVGDKVIYEDKIREITKIVWEEQTNTIAYKLDDKLYCNVINDLQPYKEEIMEEREIIEPITEINLNHPCFGMHNEIELIIPAGWEFEQRGNKMFGVRKQPKDYEECCKILNIPFNGNIVYAGHWVYGGEYLEKHLDVLRKFQQLLICRDAYWKLAGTGMGLDKPWKPDFTNIDNCYLAIKTCKGEISLISTLYIEDCILVFPTKEMRDAFFENFKDLIEQCKELL